MMRVVGTLAAAVAVLATTGAVASAGPAQGTQSDASFASSFAAKSVRNVSATSQRISCYRPEVAVEWRLDPAQGYLDGGLTPCPGATTGEDLGPYPTQDAAGAANGVFRAKDF